MNLLCRWFGHQPPVYAAKGWYSPGEEYARVLPGGEDGMGIRHDRVESECPRCGEKFILCRIHTNPRKETRCYGPDQGTH